MLIEASIQDLLTSTNQIDTTARQHVANQVQLVGGFQTTQLGSDLLFQCTTSTGHIPKIRIVNFTESTDQNSPSVVLTTGESLNIDKISTASQSYVSCDCEDFIYRFAATDQQRGVLFGKITRPSIPKSNRPSQNLGKIGVCKHLVRFIQLLKQEQLLQ